MSASIYFELCKIKSVWVQGNKESYSFGAELFKFLDEKYDLEMFSTSKWKFLKFLKVKVHFLRRMIIFYFSFCSKYSPKIEIFNTIH
jgi:hypothetical protein